MSKQRWGSRMTFILAAIGSAVGLGNCWRFPGLVAKHGGGTFLMVYLAIMAIVGVPLLTMEIAIGRRMRGGAPKSLKGLKKGGELIGWSAVANGFFICCYYTVIFAWVIAMIFGSVKFGWMTGDPAKAAGFFLGDVIQTTGTPSFAGAGSNIPGWMLIALLAAWGLVYYCIRNGASSVGKVVKYTVFIPVILLVVLAFRGLFIGKENVLAAMGQLFIPRLSALKDVTLWIDAFGQVFYSLSIMMAIMIAYGAYLPKTSNIAVDGMIIAISDMLISVLSSIVLFLTMYGCQDVVIQYAQSKAAEGVVIENMAQAMASFGSISTAFQVYPMAIVNFTGVGAINAVFGMIFYMTLATLAIDSAFSIAEGVSMAFSDKFGVSQKKTTMVVVIIMAFISVLFITGAGLAWLDIVDNWANSFNLILIGIAECILVGWIFKPKKVLMEINRNTKKFKMPRIWFSTSIKFIAPTALAIFFVWNLVSLIKSGGYGGYDGWAQVLGGWMVMAICITFGIIMKIVCCNKKLRPIVKAAAANDKTWDEMENVDDEDEVVVAATVEEAVVVEEVVEATEEIVVEEPVVAEETVND